MRLHRIFTDQALQPGASITVESTTAHYLARVLRVATGQPLVLFNGDGADYAAEMGRISRDATEITVRSKLPVQTESPLNLTLVQSVSRGERMDTSVQKATELGVSAIQPVFSARTEVRLSGSKLDKRMEHWRKVIISACEQCGRARLPLLHPPAGLLDWANGETSAQRLVLAPEVPHKLLGVPLGPAVEIAVGPEGGFEQAELTALASLDVLPVSLGPRILRTETAGPAAVALLQARGGDLG